MKKLLSLAMALTLVLASFAMFAVSSSAETAELVAKGAEWDVITSEDPDATAPEGWLDGTDTAEWTPMAAPICGEAYSGGHNHGDMTHSIVTSAHKTFMRKTFTVADASKCVTLTLGVIYDEDPVVYVNGTQVWTATSYNDREYVVTALDTALLKDGENTICVEFKNAVGGGGSMLDLYLTADAYDSAIKEDGSVVITNVTKEGFAEFGGINVPSNILDGVNNNCSGSNWDANAEQFFTVTFLDKVDLSKVVVSCKAEGAPADGGAWGTYDIYAINGETETKIGTIDAYGAVDAEEVEFDGGKSLDLAEAVEADGIKIVITSWNGSAWAQVADVWVFGSEIEEEQPPVVDPDPTPDPEPEPPVAGDATALIAVLAVVALLGGAVVSKKVFVK